MKKTKKFVEEKIKYSKEKIENNPIGKYTKDGKMSEEQMSGYYQGMSEWLHAVLYMINEQETG